MRAFFFALGLMLFARMAIGFEIEEERFFDGGAAVPVLQIISTTDIEAFAPVITRYMERHPGRSVRYVVAGSRDVYRALNDERSTFDLAISSAMDLQMKLANDGVALPHASPDTADLPDWAHWRDLLFAFAQEPVVLAVSLNGLGGLPTPRTRDELTELIRTNPDKFIGRIGTYDPALSGAGYLFATQDARRSDTFWRLAEVMGRVRPRFYASTGAMIDDLRADRLVIAYNVLGSYADERLAGAPDILTVELRDFTHVLLRTALLPVTGENPDLGREFLDFLLSDQGQESLAQETGLPRLDETALARQPHLRPIRLDPGLLVFVDPLKRQRFLDAWSAAVIQP